MKSTFTFKYGGKSKSVVVNHEEQYSLLSLNRSKTVGFSATDDEVRHFLSEEEYFSIVNISSGGNNFQLKDVKRTGISGPNVRLKFKSVR